MDHTREQEKKEKKRKKKKGRLGMWTLHILQHAFLVTAVVLVVIVLLGSYVAVDTVKGTAAYQLMGVEQDVPFEESDVFNTLLGNSASDLICYGTIRGQLETEGQLDIKKEVDVTAFAGRYGGMEPEYITARYYLDDLLKWAQAGFSYEEVAMSGEDVDRFLSRSRTVTRINLEDYDGGRVSYLNSDLSNATTRVDVSGNLLEEGITDRDPVNATVLNNRYYTVDGKRIENHVSTWEEYYELCRNVQKAAEDLNTNYNEYLKYKEYYDPENTNVVYFIRKTIGDQVQVFGNMETQTESLAGLKKELKEQCGKYLYYNAGEMEYETNTRIEEGTIRYIINGYEYSYPKDTQIMIGVRSDYRARDCFYQANEGFQSFLPYLWQYLTGGAVCGGIYLLLLILLTMKEGRAERAADGERIFPGQPQDRIPIEPMLLAGAGIGAGFVLGIKMLVNLMWQWASDSLMIVFAGTAALLASLLFSFFYYSIVRRIKAGSIWKESLIRRLIFAVVKGVSYAYDQSDVLLRVWGTFIGLCLLNIGGGFLLAYFEYNGAVNRVLELIVVFGIFGADGIVGYMLYRSAMAKQVILKGIELIRDGDLTHKVREEGMHGEDLHLAQAVNSIGESVRTAVETSMKDERLKADLITNVSHDIKTPLTSIINYVDLIKRENVQEPKIREYIEVLDAKSQRLKQLTDDLVEASKISSGNIVLQWEKINLVELLNQTIGEFSERFETKGLHPVLNAPKGSVMIEADSRRIWRVIENLFNNIFKYALPGTRVYIDLEFLTEDEADRQIQLSVKNISAQPLKVNPAELTERFIRGDESRTTEGSGLGLSIAKNLTEAQRGRFEIVVDGDLFKVNLIFPLIQES